MRDLERRAYKYQYFPTERGSNTHARPTSSRIPVIPDQYIPPGPCLGLPQSAGLAPFRSTPQYHINANETRYFLAVDYAIEAPGPNSDFDPAGSTFLAVFIYAMCMYDPSPITHHPSPITHDP